MGWHATAMAGDGDRVRLIPRGSYDWTKRYPWIVETALKNRVEGVADFNALHSRKCDAEVQLYAFDILALDGDDLHSLPDWRVLLPYGLASGAWRGTVRI
jgi:ATP-dependent DNA ligase